MEGKKREKVMSLEMVLLGTIVIMLIAQTLFSILNFHGVQQLKAFFRNENTSVLANEFQELIDKEMIDVELIDEQGGSASLESLIENSTILVFSNHSCHACQTLYPELKEFSRNNQEVRIILITSNTPEENNIFLNGDKDIVSLGWKVMTGNRHAFDVYHISGTPTLVFIDEKGFIRNIGYASSKSQIVELIYNRP